MAKVKMYGTAYCPFCVRARTLLEENNIVYDYVPVDNNPTLRKEMEQASGRTTVPQIFINDKPIGGCDDLTALHQSGKLSALLEE